jgi:hypothetical protein
MPESITEERRNAAEAMRRALIEAAMQAYEDAGLSGVCEEGRWEAAIGAMRSYDLPAAVSKIEP